MPVALKYCPPLTRFVEDVSDLWAEHWERTMCDYLFCGIQGDRHDESSDNESNSSESELDLFAESESEDDLFKDRLQSGSGFRSNANVAPFAGHRPAMGRFWTFPETNSAEIQSRKRTV